jgi:hypothetical protein
MATATSADGTRIADTATGRGPQFADHHVSTDRASHARSNRS